MRGNLSLFKKGALGLVLMAGCVCVQLQGTAGANPALRETEALIYDADIGEVRKVEKIQKSEEEWKKQLTEEQYYVTRKKGTERAFTGKYHDYKGNGIYRCVACGTDLFSSDTKFDSGTGWPSYWAPVSEHNIDLEEDRKFFMVRTEVLCSRCGAHLGHVFDDGPAPTGKRYCINSAALQFKENTAK